MIGSTKAGLQLPSRQYDKFNRALVEQIIPHLEALDLTGGLLKFTVATRAWEQANIHAPRLGDAALALKLNISKMDNGPYQFPAFWPETIDWAPDHNWGGSGMIGMQEMLMQTHSWLDERGKIRILPAWPTEWNVDFKLHAPHRTTVECKVQSGKITYLNVTPKKRQDDVVLMNERKLTNES